MKIILLNSKTKLLKKLLTLTQGQGIDL